MCGIVGFWRHDGGRTVAADLSGPLERLKHRGPDDEGFLVVDRTTGTAVPLKGNDSPEALPLDHWRDSEGVEGDILLGHRRLSILDLSLRGHQPMTLDDGKVWIVYNGEVYNYLELREELKALGHTFHTGTDTEVILHAWSEWREECLNRFNGDWAFALLDMGNQENPTLLVARDRWGVKPLFFAETAEGFWFASEAKALAGYAVPFRPRDCAVERFLLGELPPGNREDTFFENIQQLPPGHAVRIDREGTKKFQWYDLSSASRNISQPESGVTVREMESQMDRAVGIRLRADVPVGSCLSGGVDSSAIVGTMRQLLDENGEGELHTFSAVYREEGPFNESKWIHQVVDHSKSQAHYAWPDEQPLHEMFEKMVWHQDEPFQTSSIFAQWCVMREARENGVTVMLDGQAADELFAGYQPGTYQEQFLEWLSQGNLVTFGKEWVARKFTTGLPWGVLIRELLQILVHGSTGVLRMARWQINPRERLLALGFREDVVESIHPPSQTDESLLKAKLDEDLEKLARWKHRLKKNPGDEELVSRIEKKKQLIASNRQKLARSQSTGSDRRWLRFREGLRISWNRLRGTPRHNLRDYLLSQTTGSSIPHLLRFEDRNSMAFSIEARVPFTDFEMVEWAFTRANQFKIHRGWTKWVLRESMKGRVPPSVLWRRDKIGFETPDAKMTQRLIEQCGFDPAQSEFLLRFLDRDRVREIFRKVVSGEAGRDEGRLVWRWLVLDSWHRQFSAAASPSSSSTEVPA